MNFVIDSITLDGFTGMWLNDIKHFKFTVTEAISLVLGRNGCGKSRLMAQLSPLSPNKSDFFDGGFKILECSCDGKKYTLTFVKKGKGLKCTLVNDTDDITICEHANPSVFNGFVKELFGYTKDMHDLFTGQVRLTTMRTPDRRKWFSLLSESNLTYALSFYKKAREHNRDASGVIKSLKRSIGELRPLVLECAEARESLAVRIDELQSDITIIDGQLRELPYDTSITDVQLDLIEKHVENINREVESMDLFLPESYEDMRSEQQLAADITYIDGQSEGLLSKIEDLENRIHKSKSIINVDVDGLKRTLDEQQVYVEVERTKLVLFPDLYTTDQSTLSSAKRASEDYCDILIDAMSTLTTDLPIDNCRKRLNDYKVEAGETQKYLNQLSNKEARQTAYLKHAEGVCEVTCTSCSHNFKPGVTDTQLEQTKTELTQLSDEIKRVKDTLAESDELISTYSKFCIASDNIATTLRNYKYNAAVSLLFDSLIEVKAFTESPSKHLGIIRQFQTELSVAVHIGIAKSKVETIENDLKLIEATQAENTDELELMKGAAELKLGDLRNRRDLIQKDLRTVKEITRTQARADELESELFRQSDEYGRVTDTIIANVKASVLNEHKTHLWELLTTAKHRYNDMEQQRQKLEYQEVQLDEAEKRFESTKLLVKAMSPDEGILARYLYQCITRITDLMTGYINKIWGYEMEIQPCKVDDGEIDYKFPFWTKDRSRHNEDVGQGSKAQKEVIDFVFVLAAYRAMGLERYPIWLDEISSGFDDGHRSELMDFIKELVAKQHHSQCFMVSHDATTHFKLTHADVVVIDPDGISVPAVYNKNVTIC